MCSSMLGLGQVEILYLGTQVTITHGYPLLYYFGHAWLPGLSLAAMLAFLKTWA